MVTDDASSSTSSPVPRPPRTPPPPTDNKGSRPPSHFPPLWLARRTACIQQLRKEGIKSVADLGCGPGAVLSLLTQPAQHLDDFPGLYPPEPYSPSPPSSPRSPRSFARTANTSAPRKLDVLRQVPRCTPRDNQLHLRKVVGVDIDRASLDLAVGVTAPPTAEPRTDARVTNIRPPSPASEWTPNVDPFASGSAQDPLGDAAAFATSPPTEMVQERWEPLTVEIYEGALEVFNETLESIEAVIATEVIEHLTPPAFNKFAQTILGVYAPRIVIVTTPNHEFNPYFVPDDADQADAGAIPGPKSGLGPSAGGDTYLFPDPTGRTNRVFRDHDHKFEMTRAEFEDWAKRAADDYDYTVNFGGVGSLAAYYSGTRSGIPNPPPSMHEHPALANEPSCTSVPDQPHQFYATQIAVFRKIIAYEAERSPRSHRPQPLPFFSSPSAGGNGSTIPLPGSAGPSQPSTPQPLMSPPLPSSSNAGQPLLTRAQTYSTPHRLVKTHYHAPHSCASIAAPPIIILRRLASVFGLQDPSASDATNISSTTTSPPAVPTHTAASQTLEATQPPRRKSRHPRHRVKAMTLGQVWRLDAQWRELCGGEIGKLVDAMVDAEGAAAGHVDAEAEDVQARQMDGQESQAGTNASEWAFELVEGEVGEEALRIRFVGRQSLHADGGQNDGLQDLDSENEDNGRSPYDSDSDYDDQLRFELEQLELERAADEDDLLNGDGDGYGEPVDYSIHPADVEVEEEIVPRWKDGEMEPGALTSAATWDDGWEQ